MSNSSEYVDLDHPLHKISDFKSLAKVYFLYIVKPWSKSESKPLSQQAPKLNKSSPQKRKEGFGPWADTKITWATTTTTTTTPPITFKHEGVLW